MTRKPKPKPNARDWRVQTLMPGRNEIAALADLRKLASAVRTGGAPVAGTIEHWELTDIADRFERMMHRHGILMTPAAEAEYEAWQRQMDIQLGYVPAATLAVDNTEPQPPAGGTS